VEVLTIYEQRPSAEKSNPVESPLGARHRELRRAAPPAQRNDANSSFNKRLHISSKNNGAANISTETKYQNLRQADKDTRVRLPPPHTNSFHGLTSFSQAVSSYRHELSKTDPPVRIWYQVDTAVGKMSIRTQVNESEVPDGAIWFADWEVMANEDKAQFGHNYQQYREMKRRQKALRRGELENV
jgi:hypothetical protein